MVGSSAQAATRTTRSEARRGSDMRGAHCSARAASMSIKPGDLTRAPRALSVRGSGCRTDASVCRMQRPPNGDITPRMSVTETTAKCRGTVRQVDRSDARRVHQDSEQVGDVQSELEKNGHMDRAVKLLAELGEDPTCPRARTSKSFASRTAPSTHAGHLHRHPRRPAASRATR